MALPLAEDVSTEKPTLREVVAVALSEAWIETEATRGKRKAREDELPVDTSILARLVQSGLKAAGYSIHRSGECVHPRMRRDELGRPMTPEEARALGIGTDPAT